MGYEGDVFWSGKAWGHQSQDAFGHSGSLQYLKSNSSIVRRNSEKAMAPHSSTPAWKIPWMEEPGGLQSMGSLRVGHDWATSLSLFTFMHCRRKWQPTPVFLPGESQGRGSLVGCRLWGCRVGHDWSNAAATAAAAAAAAAMTPHTLKQKYWLNMKRPSDTEVSNHFSEIRL